MDKGIVAKQSIVINASPARVWDALLDPAMIKKYLFGTEVISDWKIGSPIKYKGVWKEKPYEDKGTILNVVPERLLESTYWSSMGGLSDIPENYKKITWQLFPETGGTRLLITQDNNATEEERNHSEQNWKIVLESIKSLLESDKSLA